MKLAHIHARKAEPIWHVQLAIVIAVAMQLGLNSDLTVGPRYAIAVFELVLLFVLTVISPKVHGRRLRFRRALAFALIALITISNVLSLALVLNNLFSAGVSDGKQLIISAVLIYLTNIILFGLWYWELDGSGPGSEAGHANEQDFLFPQTTAGAKDWEASFFDYLYISITNASAFSPTDTLPLSHRAKLLMSSQAFISLATVALVAARAVNILA